MKKITFTLFILLQIFINNIAFAEVETLSLVYKEVGKSPYMEEAPDNSGLYEDLLVSAAAKIGFNLEIIRSPKVRTYKMLEHGEADLYPSGEFRDYRAKFLHYIPNGLFRYEKYLGLTALEVDDIKQLSDINKFGLVWIVELGSSWPKFASQKNINNSQVKGVKLEKAVRMIQEGRSVFCHVIKEEFEKYLEDNNVSDPAELGLKVHENLIEDKAVELYLGFSRQSKYFKEQVNEAYDESKPLSANNYPTMPVPGSVADKLKEALEEMIESGEVHSLVMKYKLSDAIYNK